MKISQQEVRILLEHPEALFSYVKAEHKLAKRLFGKKHIVSKSWKRFKATAREYMNCYNEYEHYVESQDDLHDDGYPYPLGHDDIVTDYENKLKGHKKDIQEYFDGADVRDLLYKNLGLFKYFRVMFTRANLFRSIVGAYAKTPWQIARERVSGVIID